MLNLNKSAAALVLVFAAGLQSALAEDDPTMPLDADGPYAAVLGRFIRFDGDNALDYGFGATIAAGLRRGPVAFELAGSYTRSSSHSSTLLGGSVNGLVFPFRKSLPGLFALIGAGVTNVDKYPGIGSTTFNVTTVDGGVGYLLPLKFGDYQFGLRAQALYEYGKRQARAQDQRPPAIDLPIASNYHDLIANVGLQFPFGTARPPAPPPEPPVTVVPVAPVADSDADGVPDSADQCPDTPAGTKVDAKGCPLPPPCKTPAPGEHISLAGCGTGDSIVLHGVNFDTDKAKLTVNAKTILDDVAGELNKYPAIQVEIGGYTDSKGLEAHNQGLSQRRAASAKAYLAEKGIDAGRMTAAGYGAGRPVADNGTAEGRELNRRVELKITGGAADVAAPAAAASP